MEIRKAVASYKQDIIEDIRSLMAVRSVMGPAQEGMPFGEGPAEALSHALSIGEKLGFKSKNLENYCGYLEMGEGEELIGILAHVDIVPEGGGWTHDPYGGEIENGRLYGRGATDNKGPAVIAMYAMKILKDLDVPLNKRIRLVLGANEESGFECIKYYKKHEEEFSMGFTPDASFPLIFGEKGFYRCLFSADEDNDAGLVLTDIKGGEAVNVVAPSCYAALSGSEEQLARIEEEFRIYGEKKAEGFKVQRGSGTITLELTGKPAHASRPLTGLNAISLMAVFLSKFLKDSTFISGYADLIGTETDGKSLGAACADKYGELTLNVGMISMKDKKISAAIDIRYPITIDFKPVIRIIDKSFESRNIANETTELDMPLFVEPASEFIKALHSAYIEVTGDTLNQPFTIGGGTYAREFRNVVAFGPEFQNSQNSIHMNDEFLSIDDIVTSAEIYVSALINLLKI